MRSAGNAPDKSGFGKIHQYDREGTSGLRGRLALYTQQTKILTGIDQSKDWSILGVYDEKM
jgi:hypothetical protein